MQRSFATLALLLSTAAFGRANTPLDELRRGMYRVEFNRGIPINAQMHNVDPDDIGITNRVSPFEGEEGHFTAVRFTPSRGFGVQKVSYVAPVSDLFGVNCTVSDDRLVELYVTTELTPPKDELPVASVLVPGIANAPSGDATFDVLLPDTIWVSEGETLFVAIEMPGQYPDVGCLRTAKAGADAIEDEYWSFATEAPFDWVGFDDLSGLDIWKPLVSISGYIVI